MISFKYAFAIAEEYVMYDDQNRIAIDKDLLIEDGVSKDNIQIITKWKKHHNQIQKAMNSGIKKKLIKLLIDLKMENSNTLQTLSIGHQKIMTILHEATFQLIIGLGL